MTVEAFDFQSAILHFFAAVLATIEPNNSVSNNVKNCRIGPFVPAIKDSAALYDVVYKLMKALHTSLPADTLQGHRDRFTRQYHALRKYFKEIGKMEYIKKFVDIPELPPEPPNFLIGSFNELMLSQQIITHDINVEESLPSISQVEATDNVMSATLIELQQPETTPIAPNQSEQSLFDITFGTKEFEPFIPDEQLQSTSSSSLAADER
jgi:huntingtin interacting protein 1